MSEGYSQKPTGLKIPRGFLYGGLIAMTASWIPLSLIALARVSESDKPRVHFIQDMDVQPRYGAQDVNALMPDGRAMREPVAGAVARGELRDDDHFDRGYATDGNLKAIEVAGPQGPDKKWFATYPDRIRVHEVLDRGRERYDIYCSVCHGQAGFGDGMVHRPCDGGGCSRNRLGGAGQSA